MRHPLLIPRLTLIAVLLGAAPLAHAQVYKWVDEKGVVNYGNKPPAPAKGSKAATVVEDRVSVYTPDAAVTQATQNARERSALPNPSGWSAQPPPERRTAQPPVPTGQVLSPAAANDPCVAGDVNCYGYPGYPAYPGRFRAPPLNQPQLPAGAIAGNVNAGNGYIPGLSGQQQPVVPPGAVSSRSGRDGGGRRDQDERGDRGDRGERGGAASSGTGGRGWR